MYKLQLVKEGYLIFNSRTGEKLATIDDMVEAVAYVRACNRRDREVVRERSANANSPILTAANTLRILEAQVDVAKADKARDRRELQHRTAGKALGMLII